MTLPVREVVGAVYDRAFSCRMEDVLHSKTLKGATFPGPRWQKGFFDHGIRAEESYEQKWVYVRDNPVLARLVRSAEDWLCPGEIAKLPY